MLRTKAIGFIKNEIEQAIKNGGYKKVEFVVKDQLPLLNQSCHYNATHEAKSGRAVCVVEIVASGPVAHYINMDSNGDYYDITLGWSWSGSDCWIMRHISSENEELNDAAKMLGDFKKRLVDKASWKSKLLMKVFFISKWDVC